MAASPGRTLGQWLNAHKIKDPRDKAQPPLAGVEAARTPAVPRQLPPPPAKGGAASSGLPPKPPAIRAAGKSASAPSAAANSGAGAAGAADAGAAAAAAAPLHSGNPLLGSHLLGRRIKVWWPLDQAYYHGTVKSFHDDTVRCLCLQGAQAPQPHRQPTVTDSVRRPGG